MSSMSHATLVGRLTRDAELKYTNNGQAVCNFSLATNDKNHGTDVASFWDIEYWGKPAEAVNQYLTKGKLVAIEGRMKQDRWEKDGQKMIKVRVTANSVTLLGGPDAGQTVERKREPVPAQGAQAEEFSDEIPF
jgi:single-strand DNA-binding protein